MTERKTPLCHRAMNNSALYDPRCVGSDCALWVPATDTAPPYAQVAIGVYQPDNDDDVKLYRRGPDSGSGWCADNLRCEPWSDPAGGSND